MAARVTVVMACFNAATTLAAAIESVRGQTLTDWELIVVDDGSTDESAGIVEAMAQREPRVRLARQANGGPSRARNAGVALSTTPHVAFLDADDVWEEKHLELTVAALEREPGLGVAFAPCRVLRADGTATGERTRAFVSGVSLADILSSNPTATCSAVVVRRAAFDDAGPMREDMVHAEDQEWLFRVLHAGWGIRSIGCATVGYRTSPGGLSADVGRMAAGWECFARHARALAPAISDEQLSQAHARMQLYYAQRRMRARDNGNAIRRHICTAIKAFPRILTERPQLMMALAVGSVAPALVDKAIQLRRRFRHA